MSLRSLHVTNETPLYGIGLVITEACNFRCQMCNYWQKSNPRHLELADLELLARAALPLGLKTVTITGGEPLMHPQWEEIARAFHPASIRICTNGGRLRGATSKLGQVADRVVVSVDGASADTFKSIRGADLLDRIWRDTEALKTQFPNLRLDIKFTIQRENFTEIPRFIEECLKRPWVDSIGFGFPDYSGEAFEIADSLFQTYCDTVSFQPDDADKFEECVETVHERYGDLFESGYVFEGPLRRYVQRVRSLLSDSPPPRPRQCSIPKTNFVVQPDGRISGCFFLDGPTRLSQLLTENPRENLSRFLNQASAFSSLSEPTCRSCDQLLFNNSPFETVS